MLLSVRLPFLFGTLFSLIPHWLIFGVAGLWMLLIVASTVFARLVAVTLGAKAGENPHRPDRLNVPANNHALSVYVLLLAHPIDVFGEEAGACGGPCLVLVLC